MSGQTACLVCGSVRVRASYSISKVFRENYIPGVLCLACDADPAEQVYARMLLQQEDGPDRVWVRPLDYNPRAIA